jgi:hypothetical protein
MVERNLLLKVVRCVRTDRSCCGRVRKAVLRSFVGDAAATSRKTRLQKTKVWLGLHYTNSRMDHMMPRRSSELVSDMLLPREAAVKVLLAWWQVELSATTKGHQITKAKDYYKLWYIIVFTKVHASSAY